MDDTMLTALAVRVLESWFLSLGFTPCGGWDPADPNCMRDYGPHRIWTVQARCPDDADCDALSMSFLEYIHQHNALPGAIKFEPYNLELYECPCGCGTFVFASIYQ